MFTEHSEASRKGTKGLAQQCCKITTSCRSLGDPFVDLNVTLRRAIDFEILMSLPEDDGRRTAVLRTIAV
jgi:hypothetical protein